MRCSEDAAAALAQYKQWEWNPAFLAEAASLSGDAVEIDARFGSRLAFGTAGLRARMGAGFARMNDLTVLQTTQGIAAYLEAKFGASGRERGAVIGFDGRHNSQRFAHVAAAALLARGFRVRLNSRVTATPMNPFAVVKFGAVIGVQITASHNPKQDNGYKVYADNGAQIVPPMDGEVAALILQHLAPDPAALALLDGESGMLKSGMVENGPLAPAAGGEVSARLSDPYDEVFAAYMGEIPRALVPDSGAIAAAGPALRVVYTALHGVGHPFVAEIFRRIDFANCVSVAEQEQPDPEFPTVVFPNPEEKGALSLAQATADRDGVSIVIANDPDADRFACAEKRGGAWHAFHGDELGILFAAARLEALRARGVAPRDIFFICSAVSSRMVEKMARVEGATFVDSMTGFKWMMNAALPLHRAGKTIGLVYEEALGYALSMACPDKDGVSAAAVWVDMCARLVARKMTIGDRLDELRTLYGHFVTNNSYLLTDKSTSIFNVVFEKIRNGGSYITHVGNFKLRRIRDVTTGFDNGEPGNKCAFPVTPSAQMITLYFENGAVVTLRTSGTEPKLKYYAELPGADPAVARKELNALVEELVEHLCQRPTERSFKRV